MFVIGVGVFTVSSFLAGLAPTAEVLVAARLLQGIGGGLLNPQVSALIQQMFRGAERGRAFGLFGTTVGISTAIGPILGGTIIATLGVEMGWRWIFFVNIPVGIGAILLALRWIPGSHGGGPQPTAGEARPRRCRAPRRRRALPAAAARRGAARWQQAVVARGARGRVPGGVRALGASRLRPRRRPARRPAAVRAPRLHPGRDRRDGLLRRVHRGVLRPHDLLPGGSGLLGSARRRRDHAVRRRRRDHGDHRRPAGQPVRTRRRHGRHRRRGGRTGGRRRRAVDRRGQCRGLGARAAAAGRRPRVRLRDRPEHHPDA